MHYLPTSHNCFSFFPSLTSLLLILPAHCHTHLLPAQPVRLHLTPVSLKPIPMCLAYHLVHLQWLPHMLHGATSDWPPQQSSMLLRLHRVLLRKRGIGWEWDAGGAVDVAAVGHTVGSVVLIVLEVVVLVVLLLGVLVLVGIIVVVVVMLLIKAESLLRVELRRMQKGADRYHQRMLQLEEEEVEVEVVVLHRLRKHLLLVRHAIDIANANEQPQQPQQPRQGGHHQAIAVHPALHLPMLPLVPLHTPLQISLPHLHHTHPMQPHLCLLHIMMGWALHLDNNHPSQPQPSHPPEWSAWSAAHIVWVSVSMPTGWVQVSMHRARTLSPAAQPE